MAAKIKDGLFIGDAETSQSEVFINDNKISNLINVAGRDVPNVWASHGLVYLTYNWEDRPDYRLLTGHEDSILTDIVEFIDVSISHGISVLIFSKRGTGRCIIAACLYLMMKYRWGFEKSYDYVFSKKPDVDLNKGFIQQMFALDMKLLASRQKAYALKHGIDNGFRIEPNMTINDIAAMLPVNEAKRWNSWDPSYILNPNASSTSSTTSPNSRSDVADPVGMNKLIESEENVHWFKYGDSVIQTVKKKDYNIMKSIFLKQKINTRALDDMEEELVLIFSFINSKNTITSLPGPYHNAIDIPKNFKLKFDQVVFEEDINWFPPAANMKFVPKGILKGGKLQYITPSTSAANQERSQKIRDEKESSMSSSSAGVRSSMERPSSASRNDPLRSSIGSNSGSAGVGTSSGSAVGFKDGNTDDLYKFVGMSAQPKDAMGGMPTSSSSSAPRSREDKKADTNMRSSYDPESKSSLSSSQGQSGQQANTALSAEERLRKLMADMQKQSYFPEHLKPPSQSQPQQSFSSSTSQASKTTTVDPYYSTNATSTSSTAAPSLYDLANMHVAPASAGDAKEVAFIEEALSKDYATSIDLDDNLAYSTNMSGAPAGDPLAAFEINRLSGKNLSSSSSGGAGSGAMRARHDILNSTTTPSSRAGPPPVVGRTATSRQAWTSSSAQPSASTSTPTRGSSAGNPRYASPNVRSSQNNATSNVSSNYSVTSVGSNTSNNSSLPNSFVGAGSTSSAKVYR